MNAAIIQHFFILQLLPQMLAHVPSYTHQLLTTALTKDMAVSGLIEQNQHR